MTFSPAQKVNQRTGLLTFEVLHGLAACLEDQPVSATIVEILVVLKSRC